MSRRPEKLGACCIVSTVDRQDHPVKDGAMRFAVTGTLLCGLVLAACGSLNAPRLEDRAFVGLRDQYSIATIGPERKLLPAPYYPRTQRGK